MSDSWDYAQMSKTIATYGGPEKFIKAIKAGAYAAGKVRGFTLGTVTGAVAGGAVAVGVERYRRVQARAAEAEAALLAIVNAEADAADDESGEKRES